jgi:hypothetical protein
MSAYGLLMREEKMADLLELFLQEEHQINTLFLHPISQYSRRCRTSGNRSQS